MNSKEVVGRIGEVFIGAAYVLVPRLYERPIGRIANNIRNGGVISEMDKRWLASLPTSFRESTDARICLAKTQFELRETAFQQVLKQEELERLNMRREVIQEIRQELANL